MEILKFQGVFYTCEEKNILRDFSVDIEEGDFISVVGPSGSGKSTFLKLSSHLISPTEGKILLKERDMLSYDPLELRKTVSYCFQTPYLFGDDVEDNLSFPYAVRNLSIDKKRVAHLFQSFHLDTGLLKSQVKNLSGGEKQRIALIRTLLFSPEVLLLDEVTSALDVENTHTVEKVIKELNDQGMTILWITHSPEQSRKYANKVLTIESGRVKGMEVIG